MKNKEPVVGFEPTAHALPHPTTLIFFPLSARFPMLNEVVKIRVDAIPIIV